jgi:transcriptional regulator with XRE-family HTH domain
VPNQGVAESRIIRRRDVAATLQRFRSNARYTIEEAAEHLDCPPERISKIEEGNATLRTAEARQLLDLYGVVGEPRQALLQTTQHLRERTWWYPDADLIHEDFETQLILEDEAINICTHQPNLVPGLLQTEQYAWELIATLGDVPLMTVKRLARLRIARQRILTRSHTFHLKVILDEAALRRPVGSPVVMREQYQRLAKVANTPTITIQVLPFQAGPRSAMGFAFHIFQFQRNDPKIVQLELLDRVHFSQEPDEVGRYVRAFDQASARALDVERSQAFLAGLTILNCGCY